MDFKDFSRTASESAAKYLRYLQTADKGKTEVLIRKIVCLDERKFKLYIARRVPNVDALEFKIETAGTDFDATLHDVRILEYDEKNLAVSVLTDLELDHILRKIPPEKVWFESDMKFLVKAAGQWYEMYSDRLSMPCCPGMGEKRIERSDDMSDEQYEALTSCLSAPISYIWGAPGTGKTKMVLSNAIYHYARDKEKVIVMAPTNNALEQSLRGVIRVLREQGIPPERILRLGRATSEFLTEYPEVCESRFYEKLISQYRQEISEIQNKIDQKKKYDRLSQQSEELKQLFNQHRQLLLRKKQADDKVRIAEVQRMEAQTLADVQIREFQQICRQVTAVRSKIVKYAHYRQLVQQFDAYNHILSCYHHKVEQLTDELRKTEQSCDLLQQDMDKQQKEQQDAERIYNETLKFLKSPKNRIRFLFLKREKEEQKRQSEDFRKKIEAMKRKNAGLQMVLESLEQRSTQLQNHIQQEKIRLDTSPELQKISKEAFLRILSVQQMDAAFSVRFKQYEGYSFEEDPKTELTRLERQKSEKEDQKRQAMDKAQSSMEMLNKLKNSLRLLILQIQHTEEETEKISTDIFSEALEIDELPGAVEAMLKQYSEFDYDETLPEKLELRQKEYGEILEHAGKIAGSRSIIACTVDYAIIHYSEFLERFAGKSRHLFVDEAAYCPLAKAGIFFSFAIPVTFLGDHMQLPPVCEMGRRDILNCEDSQDCCLWDMSAVYFPQVLDATFTREDLISAYVNFENPRLDSMKTTFLKKTFRFDENLAAILETYVYRCGFSGNRKRKTVVEVIDAPHIHHREELRESIDEVTAIRNYLSSRDLKNFAILTPYKNQRKRLMRELNLTEDKILTVHASQGREWETVIISVVDSNRKYFMSSRCQLSDGLRVVNTAVSRCKKRLVLVMDCSQWMEKRGELLREIAAAGELQT